MNTTRLGRSAAATHVGLVRENNEDAHAVGDRFWVAAEGLGGQVPGESATRLAVRDEGRGGHVAGEVRSRLAVEAGRAYLMRAGRAPGLTEVLAAFRVASSA